MGSEQMGSEDRAASKVHRRCGPDFSTPTWPMHGRCIADASAMPHDPPTPSARTPFVRPLASSGGRSRAAMGSSRTAARGP
eukprot:1341185-Pyramimonas_sp.AAC.1